MNELTQQGINALRSGDREAARALLAAAIKQNPNDANAWLWMAGALNKDEERIHCLQQVLRIDPGNAVAAKGLAQLMERRQQPLAAEQQPTAAGQQPVAAAQQVTAPAGPVAPAAPAPAPGQQAGEPSMQPALEAAAEPAAVETPAPEASPSQATDAAQAVMPAAAPAPRGRKVRTLQEGEQVIFRTRPSLVPALIGFWFFLIGAIAIGVLMRDDLVLSLSLAIGMGFILEVIVIYTAIRNLNARYEVTNYQVSLRFRGQKVRVLARDLVAAECRQTTFQKMLGTGDLLMDGAVRGELVHLRMRNIPECDKRLGQVKALIPTG